MSTAFTDEHEQRQQRWMSLENELMPGMLAAETEFVPLDAESLTAEAKARTQATSAMRFAPLVAAKLPCLARCFAAKTPGMNCKSVLKLSAAIALFLTTTLITSCKDMRKARGLAETAIVAFHKQFNEQKLKEIYAAVHPDFKAETKEADFLALLEAMQRKLGRHVKSTDAGWMINSMNGRTSIKVTQESEFEQGKGTEIFNYEVSDGSCTLRGYDIRSREMLVR